MRPSVLPKAIGIIDTTWQAAGETAEPWQICRWAAKLENWGIQKWIFVWAFCVIVCIRKPSQKYTDGISVLLVSGDYSVLTWRSSSGSRFYAPCIWKKVSENSRTVQFFKSGLKRINQGFCAQEVKRLVHWLQGQVFNLQLLLACISNCPWAEYWILNRSQQLPSACVSVALWLTDKASDWSGD